VKAVKYLVFLFLLLLPFGSGVTAHGYDAPNYGFQLESGEIFIQSHRTSGVLPENPIDYTISESAPEVVTADNNAYLYYKNLKTRNLYLTELASRNKLHSGLFKEIIIPSLDISTLIYPFHSFL
jgi:hypothetical protein